MIKHAGARHVRIEVGRAERGVRLSVADDGRGFDPTTAPESDHFGLALLTGLVRDAGGDLSVESAPRRGTIVSVEAEP